MAVASGLRDREDARKLIDVAAQGHVDVAGESRLSVQEHGLTAYDHVRDAGPVKRQRQPGEKCLVDLHSALQQGGSCLPVREADQFR
jgi:hypothetical protein